MPCVPHLPRQGFCVESHRDRRGLPRLTKGRAEWIIEKAKGWNPAVSFVGLWLGSFRGLDLHYKRNRPRGIAYLR